MSTATLVARGLLVLVVLAAALWCVRRTEGARTVRRTGTLQVLGSARVGKGASVAVVRIGDAEYALGVTDAAVNLLVRTGDSPAEEAPAPAVAATPVTPAPPAPAASPAALPAVATAGRTLPSRPAAAAVVPAPRRPQGEEQTPSRRPALDPTALGARLGLALRARVAKQAAAAPDEFAGLLAAAQAGAAGPATTAAPLRAVPSSRPALVDPRTELLDDAILQIVGTPAEDKEDSPDGTQEGPSRTTAGTAVVALHASTPRHLSPAPPVTDGPVAPTRRPRTAAPRGPVRSAARMDAPARQDEEHPWTRSCRQRQVRARRAQLDREAAWR